MAEAAIVLPIVIIAVITLVLILLFYYEELSEQAEMHMYLRYEAAVSSDKSPSSDSSDWHGAVSEEKDGVFNSISGETTVSMKFRGLLSRYSDRTLRGRWYKSNGVLYKRLFPF